MTTSSGDSLKSASRAADAMPRRCTAKRIERRGRAERIILTVRVVVEDA
jgi:hypothetical protein